MKKIIVLLIALMFLFTLTGTVMADSDANDDSNDFDGDLPDELTGGDDDFNIDHPKEIGEAFRKVAKKRAEQLKEQIKQRTVATKERMKFAEYFNHSY